MSTKMRDLNGTQLECIQPDVYQGTIGGQQYLFIGNHTSGYRIARRQPGPEDTKFHYIGMHQSLEEAVLLLQAAATGELESGAGEIIAQKRPLQAKLSIL